MINIFIGTEPKTEIARKVLEFSITSQTKYRHTFHPMLGDDWRVKPANGVGTGFSLLRWDIPRRMDYAGAAIYLDADIICLGDIAELYSVDETYPNSGASVWCTYQKHKWFPASETPETSVMLIDCEKAKQNQPNYDACLKYISEDPQLKQRVRYGKIMRALKHQVKPQRIPNNFNRLNEFVNGSTLLLHYTKEPEQPWYNPKHKFADVWAMWFKRALDESYVTVEEVREAITSYQPHTSKQRGIGMNPYWKKYIV